MVSYTRLLHLLLPLSLMALLVSCASTQRYVRGPHVVIKDVPAQIIRDTTIDVLTDHDFRLASGIQDIMVFEKPGTRNDELMYGWFETPNATKQRLKVSLELGDKPKTINLVGEGMVVRDISRMQGEEPGYLYAGGRIRYGKYLKEIKRRAEARRGDVY